MGRSLSLIVAVAANGVIGRGGTLPWHLSGDLRRFREITMGHTLIMGRRTYESIGRPLPGRESIVITRQPSFAAPGCQVVGDWSEALAIARPDRDVFVIGGRQLFELALPVADRLYWTVVGASVDGDVFFPAIDWSQWQLIAEEPHPADERNEYPFSLRIYDRRRREIA
jgi:dihydrofolate reductase